MKTRFVAALAAVLFPLGAGLAALASTLPASPPPSPAPSAAPGNPLPSLPPQGTIVNDVINAVTGAVKSAYGWSNTQALGKVTYFRRYDMEVELQLGKFRDVRLHQGTIIYPRGASIQTGQTVDVRGHADANGVLEADQITIKNT
ncbi:MAG TPA: hypothetical protein VIG32_09685 [Candidatus Baltobacteraceae bacterium]|jgi:hypothetical protein